MGFVHSDTSHIIFLFTFQPWNRHSFYTGRIDFMPRFLWDNRISIYNLLAPPSARNKIKVKSMNKLILGLVIGGAVMFCGVAMATTSLVNGQIIDNGIEFLRGGFEVGGRWGANVESFKDNKTGVICYVVLGGYSDNSPAISCVK